MFPHFFSPFYCNALLKLSQLKSQTLTFATSSIHLTFNGLNPVNLDWRLVVYKYLWFNIEVSHWILWGEHLLAALSFKCNTTSWHVAGARLLTARGAFRFAIHFEFKRWKNAWKWCDWKVINRINVNGGCSEKHSGMPARLPGNRWKTEKLIVKSKRHLTAPNHFCPCLCILRHFSQHTRFFLEGTCSNLDDGYVFCQPQIVTLLMSMDGALKKWEGRGVGGARTQERGFDWWSSCYRGQSDRLWQSDTLFSSWQPMSVHLCGKRGNKRWAGSLFWFSRHCYYQTLLEDN